MSHNTHRNYKEHLSGTGQLEHVGSIQLITSSLHVLLKNCILYCIALHCIVCGMRSGDFRQDQRCDSSEPDRVSSVAGNFFTCSTAIVLSRVTPLLELAAPGSVLFIHTPHNRCLRMSSQSSSGCLAYSPLSLLLLMAISELAVETGEWCKPILLAYLSTLIE
jgi:hypothetical protein